MIRKTALFAVVAALLGAVPAMADDAFRTLARETGAAIAYRNAAPAAPLGVTGFDASAEVSAIDVSAESRLWKATFDEETPEFLYVPSLRVRKGLPFGIDIGGRYAYVPDTDIKLYGIEVSKALLEGTAATPALGIRGTYTRLAGINNLRLQTAGIDASISKGFLFLTPYAGVGALYVDAKAKGELADLTATASEQLWQPRYFAGLEIKPLPLVRVLGEVEYSERPIYTLKVGVGF